MILIIVMGGNVIVFFHGGVSLLTGIAHLLHLVGLRCLQLGHSLRGGISIIRTRSTGTVQSQCIHAGHIVYGRCRCTCTYESMLERMWVWRMRICHACVRVLTFGDLHA